VEKPVEVAIVHDENEWGIECIDDEADQASSSQAPQTEMVQGLRLAYEAPDAQVQESGEQAEEETPKETVDLAALRAQLKGL
jgi:hypothetical protein